MRHARARCAISVTPLTRQMLPLGAHRDGFLVRRPECWRRLLVHRLLLFDPLLQSADAISLFPIASATIPCCILLFLQYGSRWRAPCRQLVVAGRGGMQPDRSPRRPPRHARQRRRGRGPRSPARDRRHGARRAGRGRDAESRRGHVRRCVSWQRVRQQPHAAHRSPLRRTVPLRRIAGAGVRNGPSGEAARLSITDEALRRHLRRGGTRDHERMGRAHRDRPGDAVHRCGDGEYQLDRPGPGRRLRRVGRHRAGRGMGRYTRKQFRCCAAQLGAESGHVRQRRELSAAAAVHRVRPLAGRDGGRRTLGSDREPRRGGPRRSGGADRLRWRTGAHRPDGARGCLGIGGRDGCAGSDRPDGSRGNDRRDGCRRCHGADGYGRHDRSHGSRGIHGRRRANRPDRSDRFARPDGSARGDGQRGSDGRPGSGGCNGSGWSSGTDRIGGCCGTDRSGRRDGRHRRDGIRRRYRSRRIDGSGGSDRIGGRNGSHRRHR